jgi:hypothetical protein
MGGNKKSLPGAKPKGVNSVVRIGRMIGAQEQYTASQRLSQPFDMDAYERAVRRAIVDAVYLLKDWPRSARFSWYVDRNGCLRRKMERRQAK